MQLNKQLEYFSRKRISTVDENIGPNMIREGFSYAALKELEVRIANRIMNSNGTLPLMLDLFTDFNWVFGKISTYLKFDAANLPMLCESRLLSSINRPTDGASRLVGEVIPPLRTEEALTLEEIRHSGVVVTDMADSDFS